MERQLSGEVLAKGKDKAIRAIMVSACLSIMQHLLILRADSIIFTRACGRDPAKTARVLTTTAGLTGFCGLLLNQVGGKLSDCVGRKPLFMVGPAVNILVAFLVTKFPENLQVLMPCRIVKLMATNFSGTVMCNAAMMDIASGKEFSIISTKLQVMTGIGCIVAPQLESLVLRNTGDNPLHVFRSLGVLGALLMSHNLMNLPETLAPEKRISLSAFFASIASFNPFSFLKIYVGKKKYPRALKQLMGVHSFQCCLESRPTGELLQMWAQNNCKLSNRGISIFYSFWGMAMLLCGSTVAPRLLRAMTPRNFTTFTNLTLATAMAIVGLRENSVNLFGALPLMVPGVNGGCLHAVKALAGDLAVREGLGKGEFSAWLGNMRAIFISLAAMIYGQVYARCQERGGFPGSFMGTPWIVAAFLGGYLPQLLVWSMPRSDFEPIKGEKKA